MNMYRNIDRNRGDEYVRFELKPFVLNYVGFENISLFKTRKNVSFYNQLIIHIIWKAPIRAIQ